MILLVDAARLYRGEVDGLFQPIRSSVLENAIPANLRAQPTADGGIAWFGLSTRARVIVYNKVKVQREDVDSYEKLADPKHKGKVCIRSGSHPYNLSLFGAITEHLGEQKNPGLAAGGERQPCTPAQRRRHRPNQSRCGRGMRHRRHQQLLLCPPDALEQARRCGSGQQGRRGFPNQSSWVTPP